jgi:hypothetical protein
MKLSIDQRAQLRRMARYFASIERLIEPAGLDAETFTEEFRNYPVSNYGVRNKLLGIVSRRRSLVGPLHLRAAPLVDLKVIVNEERF